MANLSPSLLACNFFELEKNLDILKNKGIKYSKKVMEVRG